MKRSFLLALIFIVCFSQVSADSTAGMSNIEINLPSLTLGLYKDNILLKEYPVCVGKKSTPTPEGEYRVIYKTVDPYWINNGVVVSPGPQNPLGVRWIGITKTIGIHGNNRPESIGTYASAGCIRMYNRDVEELYSLVSLNTPVAIKYDRLKLFEDKYSREKAVIIYPDSYKKGGLGGGQLAEKLGQMGLSEELIKKVQDNFEKSIAKPIAVSQGIGIFLNESLITCDAFSEKGEIYVNYKAAEDVLGLTAETAGIYEIDIIELEGVIYVNLSQIVERFGGTMSFDSAGKNAYITMKLIKVNGAFAGLNLGNDDKSDYLQVEAVKQLGYPYSEDSIDIRIFDHGMMKVKKNKILAVDADKIVEGLGGYKDISSNYRVVDLKLPTFLKLGEAYFVTEKVDGRLVLNAETAETIREKTGWVEEAFSDYGEETIENIDLENFLEDYDYDINNYKTVIDIKLKENQ